MAEHGGTAGIHAREAGKDIDERGFAGAVRPEQAEEFATLDFKINAFQGLHVPEAFVHAANRNRDGWRKCRSDFPADGGSHVIPIRSHGIYLSRKAGKGMVMWIHLEKKQPAADERGYSMRCLLLPVHHKGE
jgi:hypothetical protein